MRHIHLGVAIGKITQIIRNVRATLESVASSLEGVPKKAIAFIESGVRAYVNTYSFMLEPTKRKEVTEADFHTVLMLFIEIFTKQVQYVVMAIRAINGRPA